MNDQTRVLVTGSDGFVGRHLVPYLAKQGYKVIAASRLGSGFEDPNIVAALLPDLSVPIDWQPLLQQCDAVVHLAGIAHKFAVDRLYDRVNHQATAALARDAFRCGTKHMIFVSSIAAQSGSFSDRELTEDDPPTPNNAYGRSKLAAEQAIRESGVSFTILRPVVIYGEGEKGKEVGPATVMRESLEIIRAMLAGNAVEYRGKAFEAFAPPLKEEAHISRAPVKMYIAGTGRCNGADPFPRARRNLHRVGSSTYHDRRAHCRLPQGPGSTALADTHA